MLADGVIERPLSGALEFRAGREPGPTRCERGELCGDPILRPLRGRPAAVAAAELLGPVGDAAVCLSSPVDREHSGFPEGAVAGPAAAALQQRSQRRAHPLAIP